MRNEKHEKPFWYYADAHPEYAHKLVRIRDGKAERYARDGRWIDGGDVAQEIKWTGDWDPVSADDVDTAIANIDHPKPRKPWSLWEPSWQLTRSFHHCLDAIEAGLITAEGIPPESGLNSEVIAALKAVHDWDLSDAWRWHNTPVGERGAYPVFEALVALRNLSTCLRHRCAVFTECPPLVGRVG
jgi:hypothetical protein